MGMALRNKLAEIKPESLTLILVNLAGIMERADESLLPGVYKEVGSAFHADPTRLGSLTLFRSIVQSCCYPLAAYLALRHNRAHVIALGAFLWAAATFLVAVSSTFAQVAVSRGLNGVGLAIVAPAIQSLVADSTDESNRGIAFGWLGFTGNLGSIIGGLLAVLLASSSFMGIAGWRIAFHIVGLISVLVGISVRLFAKDPRITDENDFKNDTRMEDHQEEEVTNSRISRLLKNFKINSEIKDLIKEAKSVVRIPTFQILIAQGVSGSIPWSALSFAPMWLELTGFSHKKTAFLWTLFVASGSIGALFGGKMGDVLAKHFPNGGRIILSQISSGSAIPLAAILLLALPDDPSTAFSHGLVLVIMGLCISWNAAATNNPIFAEIVPERSRTSIYALDRSFESLLASFAPPIVGILCQQIFGYKPIPKGSSTDSQEIATDRENAAALAKALYTAIGIPMAICCSIYSFLYCTYPRDRDRARMQSFLVDEEMQQMKTDNIDYGRDENIEFDENDQKRLLSHNT